MVDGQTKSFDVVRRGYDTDQVDQFLRTQADAWASELAESRAANEELEAKLSALQGDLENLRVQEADLAQRLESADHAYESLTEKAEREMAEKRRAQEEELAQMRIDAAAYSADIRAEAEAEAAKVQEQATKTTSEADQKARAAAEAVLEEHQGVLNGLQADFDERFARAKAQYERVLTALQHKVDELTETHSGLVSGLEAIARGGLSATVVDDLEELPGPDLGGLHDDGEKSAADHTNNDSNGTNGDKPAAAKSLNGSGNHADEGSSPAA